MWGPNVAVNPLFGAPFVAKFYSLGASIKWEMVNNDAVAMKMTVYRLKVRNSYDGTCIQLLQTAPPNGLGVSQAYYRDANLYNAALFTRYFKVASQKTYIIRPGKNKILKHKLRFGRKNSVVAKYMWDNSGGAVQNVKGIHQPVLIQFQPMPVTDGDLESATVTTPNASRFGIRTTYQFKYKELEDNYPTQDIEVPTPEPAPNPVTRAPGTLNLVSAEPGPMVGLPPGEQQQIPVYISQPVDANIINQPIVVVGP